MVDFKPFETVCLKFLGRHDDLGPLRKKRFRLTAVEYLEE